MLYWLTDKLITAYVFSTSAFLLTRLFIQSIRQRSDKFLNNLNFLVIVILTINVVLVGIQAIECKNGQLSNVEIMRSQGYDAFTSQNCFAFFIWTLLLGFLFQSAFLFNRHRQRIMMTIISVVLLIVLQNIERIIIYLTSLYRDYLPSSWSSVNDTSDFIWTIIFSVAVFMLCWTIPPLTKFSKTK
jgi:uncharacterized membrane protein YbjE (DUF340 family)